MVLIADAFQFCPRCGRAAATVGVNPFRCERCDYTQYFTPVAAVAGIVCDAQGQLLLLQRARDPGKGQFGLPGGFVEAGESAEEALIREMREEVNLEPSRMRYLTSFPNQYSYRDVTIPVTDLFYVCAVDSFRPMTAQKSEVDTWHFCHPTRRELSRMAFESNRKALELYLQNESTA